MPRKKVHKSDGLVLLADASHYGQEAQYLLYQGGVAPGAEMVLSYKKTMELLKRMEAEATKHREASRAEGNQQSEVMYYAGQIESIRNMRAIVEVAVKEYGRGRKWR